MRRRLLGIASLVVLLFLAPLGSTGEHAKEPRLERMPTEIPAPPSNPPSPAKIALGKQLFFDPRLSGDNSKSCASCHLPEKAWADGAAKGKGVRDQALDRNTPTVLNAALMSTLFWDGRANSLEEQALQPITNPKEMDQDLSELVQELNAVEGYARQFREVFGTEATVDGIAKALAAFQRTLVTRNSPLDRYLAGDQDALSREAKQGMKLFLGDAGCIRCHHGPLLSDGKYYSLGVGSDLGRAKISGRAEDRHRFRTPPLRDVARTAPYMHDGSIASLFEVVEFYYRWLPEKRYDGSPTDATALQGNSLSDVFALVAFLESLNGEPPKVEPPTLPE